MVKNIILFVLKIQKEIALFLKIFLVPFKQSTTKPNPLVCTVSSCGGGFLKKRILEQRSNFKYQPNILYFVSSDLPFFAKWFFLLAKRLSIKIVYNQNGTYFPAWFDGNCYKKNKAFATLINKSDYIIFQSKFCMRMAKKFLDQLMLKNRHSVIYNSTRECATYQKKNALKNKIKICVAGTFNFKERLETVFQICNILSFDYNINLNIFGHYNRNKITIPNKNKNLKISFRGNYNNSKINKIFSCHDLLIHTQPYDCCPTVICEAIANGLPFIAQKNGGIPELVGKEYFKYLVATNTSCLKYDWGNPEIYAKKIKKILKARNKIKKYLLKRSQINSEKHFMRKHDIIFQKVLK